MLWECEVWIASLVPTALLIQCRLWFACSNLDPFSLYHMQELGREKSRTYNVPRHFSRHFYILPHKTKLVYHHHQSHLILAQDHTVIISDGWGGVTAARFNFKYHFFYTICSMIPYSLDYTLKVTKNNGSYPEVLLRNTSRPFSKYTYWEPCPRYIILKL